MQIYFIVIDWANGINIESECARSVGVGGETLFSFPTLSIC